MTDMLVEMSGEKNANSSNVVINNAALKAGR